ncbi:P-loop NTPase fold protein [Mollicutes bacterium LVI A0039]|nr:P-loop NTPase fold protein [Mollicutes bacterium LVI A0039]
MKLKKREQIRLRFLDTIFVYFCITFLYSTKLFSEDNIRFSMYLVAFLYLYLEYINYRMTFYKEVMISIVISSTINLVFGITFLHIVFQDAGTDFLIASAVLIWFIQALVATFFTVFGVYREIFSINKNLEISKNTDKKRINVRYGLLGKYYAVIEGQLMSVRNTDNYTKYAPMYNIDNSSTKYLCFYTSALVIGIAIINLTTPIASDSNIYFILPLTCSLFLYQCITYLIIYKSNNNVNKKDVLYTISGLYTLMAYAIVIMVASFGFATSLYWEMNIITMIIGIIVIWKISSGDILTKLFKKLKLNIQNEGTAILQGDGGVIILKNNNIGEVERSILFSLFDNDQQGAILLSGPWGSGKTHTINKLFKCYEEVDLLKYGSGQNMFYAIYKSLSKKADSTKLKFNILNLVKNPELVYIIITLNLAWVPFVALFKEYFVSNGQIITEHMHLLIGVIIIINILIIQYLPEINFSKDIQNNRFRKMYLDLIIQYSKKKIVVFENIDRLNFDEVNNVLEIINHLNEHGVKVIVTADIEYLKDESKFNENKFNRNLDSEMRRNYFEQYLSRYFKDVIYIPNNIPYKVEVLKNILRNEGVFIAPWELAAIEWLLQEENMNQNIRELEYFVKKYKSKPVENVFSYEFFLHIFKINNRKSMDFKNLSDEHKKIWNYCMYKDKSKEDKLLKEYTSQNSEDCDAFILFNCEYKYANIPCKKVVYNNDEKKHIDSFAHYDKQENEALISKPLFNLSLSSEEKVAYEQVKNTEVMAYLGTLMDVDNRETSKENFIKKINSLLKESDVDIDNTIMMNKILCKMYIDIVLTYDWKSYI